MGTLKPTDAIILRRYPRALTHLRERKRSGRLALILGAGVSRDFGFPTWTELVDRLHKDPAFQDAQTSSDTSPTIRTQALLQHLKKCHSKEEHPPTAAEERAAQHEWIAALHRCLYQGVATNIDELQHPYLQYYLDLIKEAPLTVNYNFDDTVERILSHRYHQEQTTERVYETIWEPSTQFRRTKGVIYHPNGFLPYQLLEGFSDGIVFSEGEFADQLIDTMSGHYATLFSHFSRYTSVLMGLSLNDPTLKHLLRQNTHINPGHAHYYLKWCDKIPTTEEATAEAEAHFDVYGLVTVHLDSEGYEAFGRLLSCSDAEFNDMADSVGAADRFVYYISGPVGAGKTSVVQKLKSFAWLGEWIERRHPLLAKPHTELTATERVEVDTWVSRQFRSKNFRVRELGRAVIICDRSPIDPLAFTKKHELADRARKHLEDLLPGDSKKRIERGHVILLYASPEELHARASERQLTANAQYLSEQQETLHGLYGGAGVTRLSTSGRSLRDVARQVARVIHLGNYTEFDVHKRLEEIGNPS